MIYILFAVFACWYALGFVVKKVFKVNTLHITESIIVPMIAMFSPWLWFLSEMQYFDSHEWLFGLLVAGGWLPYIMVLNGMFQKLEEYRKHDQHHKKDNDYL